MKTRSLSLLLTLTVLDVSIASAADVRIAVASNFRSAMMSIVEMFETRSTHKVITSYGSTGKHYAQIINGAPYDLFFAADVQRPTLLEQQGWVVNSSRYTYAVGKLVLWGSGQTSANLGAASIGDTNIRYIALANSKLAPYGRAAEQVIDELKLREQLTGKLVRGENIAQTYQFVVTGNAELGFVAYSQIINRNNSESVWSIPQNLYDPIEQQAVMIKETIASKEFYAFMQSDSARKIIHQAGYGLL